MTISAIDLHIHTSYSDGRYSPKEILQCAAERDMHTLAFTDHDNANGYRAALLPAQELGIRLIPAVEFTCRWPHCETLIADTDVDILGYFVDVDSPAFRTFEHAALQDTFSRVEERCAILSKAGYPISLDDVFAENPHYAGAIYLLQAIQRKGYATNTKEAWRILDISRPHMRLSSFTIYQVIEHIHQASGIAVLAHPTAITRHHPWFQPKDLVMLVEMGLDGIEVYHPHLSEEARAYFLDIATRLKLVVSGGSDEHGWKSGLHRLGSQPITDHIVASLRQRAEERAFGVSKLSPVR
jgi:3',5'-nucleoside bisphosphate phosphatase